MKLQVDALSVESPQGQRLLRVPQLDLATGRSLAIRGPSGAGKSTLLFTLSGLLEVTQGSVKWGDLELAGLSDAQRTRFRGENLGLVFQDHLLFEELSASDNAGIAALYSRPAQRAGVTRQASDTLSHLGLAADTQRTVTSYSGGERQRIAVARALATQPKVLLADEPTASLDRKTADALIADLLESAGKAKRTFVVVSHDPALIEACDHVLTIEDGEVTLFY